MKTLTINKSESGSIYDIADQNCDRDIMFPENAKYAVILPSYYGGRGYTTHRTRDAAISQYQKLINGEYKGIVFMDSDGHEYELNYNRLVIVG